nr:hypothetical protein [Tanacetum cinerariifolium]
MEKEDKEIIKSINETPTQKAAKRRKLSEEAQEADDLKKRLEIIQDEDDDVFVEATLLAQKVPVVDYQVVVIDNKPSSVVDRAIAKGGVSCCLELSVREEELLTLEVLAVKNSSYTWPKRRSNSCCDRIVVSAEGTTFGTSFELDYSLSWSLICVDITKITRKPDKNGHENRK